MTFETMAEINMQERFDDDVYTSNKSMFETLLHITIAMKPCEERTEKIQALLDAYNNMADNAKRQGQMRRRLENGFNMQGEKIK